MAHIRLLGVLLAAATVPGWWLGCSSGESSHATTTLSPITWPKAMVMFSAVPPVEGVALAGVHLQAVDSQKTPADLGWSMTWPAAPAPTSELEDGAFVLASHSCTGKGPYEIRIQTCPLITSTTAPPGCVRVAFTKDGISGVFTHPDGTTCLITDGYADMTLTDAYLAARKMTKPFAAGSWTASCGRFQMTGEFQLAQLNQFLLCAP